VLFRSDKKSIKIINKDKNKNKNKDKLDKDGIIKDEFVDLMEIKKDESYDKHMIFVGTHYLQKFLIEKHIGLVDIKTLDTCLDMLTKFEIYYCYTLNCEKYLQITKMVLDSRIKHFIKIDDNKRFNENIEKYIKNVESQTYIFNNLRFTINYDPTTFKNYSYCLTNELLVSLISEYYDDDSESKEICKYCLQSQPKSSLVHVCLCTDPVHIRCFRGFYKSKEKKIKNCEICNDNYSKLNEKRILAGGFYTETSIDERMFFPFNNYYPTPLMSTNSIEKKSETEKYEYALMYLQCKRMEDLLEKAKIAGEKPNFGYSLNYLESCMPSNYLKKI
jgi:hypothetical protein